jgi:hypothetical protein
MTELTLPSPADATADQLADHLEGRPIRYSPREYCVRCEAKNDLRRQYADVDRNDLSDRHFEAGERVRIMVLYQDPPWLPGLEWSVEGVMHERHPRQSQEETAAQGVAQAMGTATLVHAEDAATVYRPPNDLSESDDDDLVLTDVGIEFYSPPSEGEDTTTTEQKGTVIAQGIGDRPDWPDEENEWRKELIRSGEKDDD